MSQPPVTQSSSSATQPNQHGDPPTDGPVILQSPSQSKQPTSGGQHRVEDTTKLVKVLIWPLTFLIVALAALYISRGFVGVKDVHISTAKGIEIEFYLLKAAQSLPPDGKNGSPQPDIALIQQQAQKASSVSLEGKTVLWADDNPGNDEYERKALEALGIKFVTATTTDEALKLLSQQHFSLIITDFMRADDLQAGYTLLRNVRNRPNPVPLIIYSGSSNAGFEQDAKRLGAVGQTNNPQTLFDMVLGTLK